MVKIQTLPYLRPSPDCITITDWMQIEGETEKTLPDLLHHWDSATSIQVSVRAQVDSKRIWQECQLADADQLCLVLLWNSSGTNLRSRGDLATLYKAGTISSYPLTARINGAELAGDIKFELQLILARPGTSPSKLAPHRPGSILWKDSRTVKIGGEGSRFPMEAISFADQFQSLPAHAAWFLDWEPAALDEPLLRSVRLFLNKDHKMVSKVIGKQEKDDKRTRQLVRQMIHFDLTRAMISAALGNEEFVQSYREFKPGTVGATIYNMILTFFPGETVEGLAGRYHTSPSRVECELQASFKLFEEV